jgi:hypothetical protein
MVNTIFIITIILIIILCIVNWYKCKQTDNFQSEPIYQLNIHTVFLLKENIPFLREWILYNLNLGFDKIYLYDNTGSIGRNGSNKTTNKYNFNFDEIIILSDNQIKAELDDILSTYKNNLVYIKWQPKNDNGDIVYGFDDSVKDYVERTKDAKNIIYTAFIDIDEFIFSKLNINLRNYIIEQYTFNTNKIILTQKKFTDRFCNKGNVIDIVDTIEDINTSGWACKQIIKNSAIDINNIVNMHNINIISGEIITVPEDMFRFNHYNVNAKQLEWMKNYFSTDTFNFTTDNSLQRYKNIIYKECNNKCSNINNIINYNKIDSSLCAITNSKMIYTNSVYNQRIDNL